MVIHTRRVAAWAGAIGAVLMVSACSNPVEGAIDDAVEEAVENGVEEAVEGNGELDVDINGDGVDLPADFPSGIPLPDAKLTSIFNADGFYSLTYEMNDMAQVDALVSEYKGSWTEAAASDMGEFKSWMYQGDAYDVTLGVVTDDGSLVMLSMGVAPADS